MQEIKLTTPLTEDDIRDLRAGDRVLLTGVIYTMRDAAHKRYCEALDRNEKPPVDLKNQVLFYVGPSPATKGRPIGAAGPTSSYRMDPYTPRLLDLGLKGMIGKGFRDENVIASMQKNKAVYFGAIGGAGALLSKCIERAEVLAYDDLGPEALRRLEVRDMPLVVVIDTLGNNLYQKGPEAWIENHRNA